MTLDYATNELMVWGYVCADLHSRMDEVKLFIDTTRCEGRMIEYCLKNKTLACPDGSYEDLEPNIFDKVLDPKSDELKIEKIIRIARRD